MHDENGFLAAIHQTPADDTARLVFADWLDEQDDPISKAKAAFIRLELQMTAAPEKSLNRVRTLERLQELSTPLDPDWLVVVSRPKLEACRARFQFHCPNRWDRLAPTDAPKVRLCDACKKNVHYCDTLQEAQNHAANGSGVALTIALVRHACLIRPPQPPQPRLISAPRRGSRLVRSVARPVAPVPAQHTEPIRPMPDMIERRLAVGMLGRSPPEPPPIREWVPKPPPEESDQQPKPRHRKKRRLNPRNIQREDWEETE